MSGNVQNIQQSHKLHHKCHCKMENRIDSGRTNPSNGKNPKTHPQGDSHLPLLFVIVMMTLNSVLRMCTKGNKFTKSQEKTYHVDGIKVSAKNEELETLIEIIRIYSQDIGMEFDIGKCTKIVMKIGKKEKQWKE